MVIEDFVEIEGVIWALLTQSWGMDFGRESPIGFPGIAMVSIDYLDEILCHGAVVVCHDSQEYENGVEFFKGASSYAKYRSRALARSLQASTSRWWDRTQDGLVSQSRKRLKALSRRR